MILEPKWGPNISRWWQLKHFLCSPLPGEMIQFDEHIFSDGLVQPPTRYFKKSTYEIGAGQPPSPRKKKGSTVWVRVENLANTVGYESCFGFGESWGCFLRIVIRIVAIYPGIPTTIKTMGVNITTIVYLSFNHPNWVNHYFNGGGSLGFIYYSDRNEHGYETMRMYEACNFLRSLKYDMV